DPYDPVPEFSDRIEFDTSRLPRDPAVYRRLDPPNMHDLTPVEREYIQALYRAEVESVDDRVGYILAALRANGLDSRTIVVFTADHGDMFGAHGHYGHGGAFWDPLLHIPLIFAGPGIDSGGRVSTFVSHLDLSPTLEQLARIDFPDAYLGQSYMSLLAGGALEDRVLYFDRITNLLNRKNKSQDAMLLDHFKLMVAGSPRNPRITMYDLSQDPGELTEIGRSRPELKERLLAEIMKIREENQVRLVKNSEAIADDVDLESVSEETKKQLRALGYID
ncbi:MAG: sulfatase-like hydrolase/transferase, partial [bacterium]